MMKKHGRVLAIVAMSAAFVTIPLSQSALAQTDSPNANATPTVQVTTAPDGTTNVTATSTQPFDYGWLGLIGLLGLAGLIPRSRATSTTYVDRT